MDIGTYFESLTQELTGLQNRVRNFIADAHWQTDGEWKESVIRYFLRRNLPNHVDVGRGFVVLAGGSVSLQIDVLIYDASKPVLFRDGDLVFVTPDAVLAVIEVKSRLDVTGLKAAAEKLAYNAERICMKSSRANKRFALFSFESRINDANASLEAIKAATHGESRRIIDLVCLGDSHLIRWWYTDPLRHQTPVQRWHSYQLEQKSFGYFLHNIIHFITPESVNDNPGIWFPAEGKEDRKNGEIAFERALATTSGSNAELTAAPAN